MVSRAQWPLGTIAQFFHFVAEDRGKQKTTENKGILWLGYHRYPSKYWRQKQFYVAKLAILLCGSIEYCGVEEGESL